MERKPILALDFDGVIHGYQSGWKGPRNIPDPPVPGALDFIANTVNDFDVQIYSSRSRYFGARRAMKQWLRKHYQQDAADMKEMLDDSHIEAAGRMERYADQIIRKLKFPTRKPPARVILDDRAITFTGKFPTRQELMDFKPWNKKEDTP